jgi:anaerobic magnesium-protoporphyrin IX monomethyl ester cyclase
MKIQLVNPYPEKFFQSQIMDCYPPLGILSIASFLESMIEGIEIEVLDAAVVSEEEIESAIDADVVGISVTAGTFKNALKISEIGKQKGAKTVLGGPYASVMAQQILLNRDHVDCVVVGDGEQAFYECVMDRPLAEIGNLVFRENGRIVENPVHNLDLDKLPSASFEFVDVSKYLDNFKRRFAFLGEKLEYSKELPIYSRKGCTWRLAQGCIFCSIFDRTYRLK